MIGNLVYFILLYRFWIAFVGVAAICFYKVFWKNYSMYLFIKKQNIPTAPYNFPFGQLKEFAKYRKDIEGLRRKFHEEYGKVHCIFMGPLPWLCVADPEMAKEIMYTKGKDFSAPDALNIGWIYAAGSAGIQGQRGKLHKAIRKMISPMMGVNDQMVQLTQNLISKLFDEWDSRNPGSKDVSLDFTEDILTTSSGSICGYISGSNISIHDESESLSKDLNSHAHTLFKGFLRGIKLSMVPFGNFFCRFTKTHGKMLQSRKFLTDFVDEKLETYDKNFNSNGSIKEKCVLSSLYEHYAEKGEMDEASRQKIKAIMLNLYAGAFPGPVAVTSMMVYILAKFPYWQEKARQEIKASFGDNYMDISAKDILGNRFLTMFLHELFRYVGFVGGTVRQCRSDDVTIGPYKIPNGLTIRISVSQMGKDQALWKEDVHEFNPYRFKDGLRSASYHPLAYAPFGGGYNLCPGQEGIKLFLKLIMVRLLTKYSRIELQEGFVLETKDQGIVSPANGMKIRLIK